MLIRVKIKAFYCTRKDQNNRYQIKIVIGIEIGYIDGLSKPAVQAYLTEKRFFFGSVGSDNPVRISSYLRFILKLIYSVLIPVVIK